MTSALRILRPVPASNPMPDPPPLDSSQSGPSPAELSQSEDVELVGRTLGGEQSAFEALVVKYQARLFGLARQYTRSAVEVEDLVQDTFLKAYSKLETYRAESSFSTWLMRIAVNSALDLRKRFARSPVTSVEDPEESLGSELCGPRTGGFPAPDEGLNRSELATITEQTLDQLPDAFRTVLVLREFEELSYVEIAELLEISIGTVESRLFRARARFRDALSEIQPELFEELGGNQTTPRKRRRLGGPGAAGKRTKKKSARRPGGDQP